MRRVSLAVGVAVAAGLLYALWGCRHDPGAEPADTFLLSGIDPGGAAAAQLIRPLLAPPASAARLAEVGVVYPFAGSKFPPDIVAPEVLWKDGPEARAWLLTLRFGATAGAIHVLCDGRRVEPQLDPACVREDNAYEESEAIASAKGWRPSDDLWERIKKSSEGRDLILTVRGLSAVPSTNGEGGRVVSQGSVAFGVSRDPVDAPLFYRDVPLMPARTREGVVKPLAQEALPLVKWRLRYVSKPESRVVMENMPTCANCHSFAADGRRMSMDMDGPDGDKGAHAVLEVKARMTAGRGDVFTWNDLGGGPAGGAKSSGLFPQMSPDGRHIVATVNDHVYVQNYMDWRFLQTFYPTRGVLAVRDTSTGRMWTLPGADDPAFVQSNPAWSPDGREIVFIRAAARDSYGSGPRATHANDPNETQIRYDLYRIPFNDGKGGVAAPVPGASRNGKSNSFPKFSPDGKWIVFVQAANGLLMRPDSKLCIVPASGGAPRVMNCNLNPMNSWHSWSPNGRWLAFSSKAFGPFTRIFLAHVDERGIDSPPVLLPNCTAANRAVNLPEFANLSAGGIEAIDTPAVDYRRLMKEGGELAKAGDTAKAERYLKESLALKDDYPDTHVAYGFVMDSLNRPQEAIARFERALALDPRHPGAHRYWAMTLIKRGDYAAAIGHLRQALAFDALDDDAYRHWGDALVGAGQPAEAEKYYARALALNAENAFAHNNLAHVLAQSGRLEEALAHYQMTVKFNAGYASGYANQGVVLARMGRGAEAVGLYRKAIELDPNHAAAHCNLALLLASNKDGAVRNGAEAVLIARKSCELTGFANPQCLLALAAAYAEAGSFDEARLQAERALALVPSASAMAADIRTRVLPAVMSGQPLRSGY